MKSQLKCLLYSFAILAGLGFKSKSPGNKDFQILSAEKQTIYGGAAGSPVITVYRLKLKALRKLTYKADSAWAEGKIDVVRIDHDSATSVGTVDLKKGDSMSLLIEIKTMSEIGGGNFQIKTPGSREAIAPCVQKDALVLRTSNGKCKYLTVSNIKTKETLYAP